MTEDERDLLQALEEQRRYYETLIAVSPIAIITGDPDLIVTSWVRTRFETRPLLSM